MSKITVIFCAYNCEEYLSKSLSPWLQAKRQRLGGHDWSIVAVSVPFEGFNQPRSDDTLGVLQHAYSAKEIDELILSETPLKETEARGRALNWAIFNESDLSWQADGDELITTEQIKRIAKFVEDRPLISSFRLSLKNYVFDDKTYLVEPFTPMRIHRLSTYGGGYRAAGFYDDNNVWYSGVIARDVKKDVSLSESLVPKTVAFIPHYTWMNDYRSKAKIEYQTKGRSWNCSYLWDEENGGLKFNPAFPTPETAMD
jgi:hypothetical protein